MVSHDHVSLTEEVRNQLAEAVGTHDVRGGSPAVGLLTPDQKREGTAARSPVLKFSLCQRGDSVGLFPGQRI